MTQAIFEIAGMLLGALAIGVFFTNRHWKSKSDSLQKANDSLQSDHAVLNTKNSELNKQLTDLKSKHKQEISQLEEKNNDDIQAIQKEHEKNLKKLKAESRSATKELKEDRKKGKEESTKIKELEKALELKNEQLGEKERELEEVTKHFTTHNISYYKQIDGKRYKAAIILEADEAVAGVGDGRISKADAEKIFATISDGHLYTQVEKDTMHYIRDNYNWTPEADELFRRKVRSWAAKGHHLS